MHLIREVINTYYKCNSQAMWQTQYQRYLICHSRTLINLTIPSEEHYVSLSFSFLLNINEYGIVIKTRRGVSVRSTYLVQVVQSECTFVHVFSNRG